MGFLDKVSSLIERIDESNNVSFNDVKETNKWKAYFYPSTYDRHRGSGVLKNLYSIKNNEILARVEKYRATSNSAKLASIEKTFDIAHYQKIHKTLFDNVYSWAGEFRQVNMGKGNSNFCDYKEIPEKLDKLFSNINHIEKEKHNPERFSDELCKFYLKLNNVHPFREGNGRTQNQFISHICEKCGYKLNLQSIMENMKKEKTDYYNLFTDYNRTKDHSEIKAFLFDRHLVKVGQSQKNEYAKKFSENHAKVAEDVKKKIESIKQQNYSVKRVR